MAIAKKDEKFRKLKKGKYKYLSETLSSDSTTLIYGNTVVFFIWKEPYFAIRIKNKEFVKGQKEHFNFLWKTQRNN